MPTPTTYTFLPIALHSSLGCGGNRSLAQRSVACAERQSAGEFRLRPEEAFVRKALRLTAAGLLALAVACAASGPVYPEFVATAPPIAAGRARLVVYRHFLTEPQAFLAKITVDAAAVGTLPMGTWLWVDEVAGVHEIDSPPWPSFSAFGDQLRTEPIEVALAPGTTTFVRVNVLTADPVRVAFAQMDPVEAQSQLAKLAMAPPPGSSE